MGFELTGLDLCHKDIHEPLQRFATRIGELVGPGALSLSLIGAAATPFHDPRRHIVRTALVLDSVDLIMLKEFSKEGPRWAKHRIAAPLVLTPDYIRASLDSFSLEFLEIQQHHRTLFGPDPFVDLSFRDADIRLQCERELKTILLGLRQSLLSCAGRDRELARIGEEAADTLVRTLRGLLWLKGRREAKPAEEVIADVGALLGRSLPGIKEALVPDGHRDWDAFRALYSDVESLLKEQVDKIA